MTGHLVVDRISSLLFSGNIVPHAWLASPTLRCGNGRLNLPAVMVLADVCYWYRARSRRDESTGQIVAVEKRFRGQMLRRSYDAWAELLGLTKRQVQEAVGFLVAAGLLRRELRTVLLSEGMPIGNVLHVEPIADSVAALTCTLSRCNVRGYTLQRATLDLDLKIEERVEEGKEGTAIAVHHTETTENAEPARSEDGEDHPRASPVLTSVITSVTRVTRAWVTSPRRFRPDGLTLDSPATVAGATFRDEATRLGLGSAQVDRQWQLMGDHEFARSKTDWSRTWRRWCRTSQEYADRDRGARRGDEPSQRPARQKLKIV